MVSFDQRIYMVLTGDVVASWRSAKRRRTGCVSSSHLVS